MNAVQMAAIILIIIGVMGLAYGGFSYPKDTHAAKVGTLELAVTEKGTVNIPIWAGVGAIAIGSLLLLLGGKKS